MSRKRPLATETFSLSAKDETPAGGLPQASMAGVEYKKYLEIKKQKEWSKKTFPKKDGKGELDKNGRQADQYPDIVPIDAERLKKHDTGAGVIEPEAMRSKFHKKKFEKHKEKLVNRAENTARAELLNVEQEGFLEADDDDDLTYTITQREIANNVDMANASKYFALDLRFGPYHIDYTDNGRHLVIGGKKGHVATFDWQTKHLHNETNTMEAIRDVSWLHTENIYAVAQKHYTYVYDNQGTELHCVKSLHEVQKLEFLPRHFLLVAGSRHSWLHYLDISVGKMVSSFCTKSGPLDVMCQNPGNAIIYTGHGNGTVSLWSPNVNEPLVRMLAHPGSVKGIAIDETGKYMVTTGLDRKCRVWDVRMYKQMHCYGMPLGLSHVAISQKMNVACAVGNTVQVFRDMHIGTCRDPYITHRVKSEVSDLKFVPFEDVLGVGHGSGFTSMLVPGSGEANVDALRANPYETKSQRREREVKQLLDKLQTNLITLNPDDITRVNETLLERTMEERKKILYVRPLQVQYTPRHKMRGKSSGAHKEMRRQVVMGEVRMEQHLEKEAMEREMGFRAEKKERKSENVLDRFK